MTLSQNLTDRSKTPAGMMNETADDPTRRSSDCALAPANPSSPSCPSVKLNELPKEATGAGVSEIDAIHPRLSGLHSSDSVSNLASAVMDQMENGETSNVKKKEKKKKSETKPKKPGKKPNEKKKLGSVKPADKIDSGKKSAKNKKALAGKVKEGPAEMQKPVEPRLPYLRIEGPVNSPNFVKIVNKMQMDEEHQSLTRRLKSSAQITDEQIRLRTRNMSFFVSAMSENYDALHRDPLWTCVFCHRHSHADSLGDLYGPYFLDGNEDLGTAISNNTAAAAPAARRRNSSAKCHTRKSESGTDGLGTQANGSHEKQRDVWFHEDCLVWAPGVCFAAPKLLGLDLALQETQDMICDHCTKTGAHIFCRFPGCQHRTHFPCAQDHGWSLQEATFTALCPLHEQVPH